MQAKSIFTDADLFTAYERTCQEVDAVCRIEETRRLRLQRILLEDENQDLHAQLEEDDGRIDRLETSILDIQTDLDVALRDSEAAQRDLKTRTREVENLKVAFLVLMVRVVGRLTVFSGGNQLSE